MNSAGAARPQADLCHHHAGLSDFRRIGLGIAFYVERLTAWGADSAPRRARSVK